MLFFKIDHQRLVSSETDLPIYYKRQQCLPRSKHALEDELEVIWDIYLKLREIKCVPMFHTLYKLTKFKRLVNYESELPRPRVQKTGRVRTASVAQREKLANRSGYGAKINLCFFVLS